ncbi:MAG: FAD-dependent oxidoreductase [Xanthomonadales bacterium]|nr:FAD-dependent oxidoreductase [Xanthomonadales bacterium]
MVAMSFDSAAASLPHVLPSHLAERVRQINPGPLRGGGEFVLLWLHHACRDHDNPALDVALHLAADLDRPVLAYQGLGSGHRHDNDRHHAFILQGARALAPALARRGVRSVFWLPMTEPDGGVEAGPARSPLAALVRRACVVVTDDMPAPPWPRWLSGLAARVPTPLLAVDSACIVPMALSRTPPQRAFAFRERLWHELQARLDGDWPAAPDASPFTGDPGFAPFDLAGDLARAIGRCRIDHQVAPVAHTPGGSEAGYRRWQAFRASGLADYHRLRNDAAVAFPQGVSRLSAYLHHGMVSARRIAREAREAGGAGAAKFLDELWTWRELAWHWCARVDDPGTLDALPDWARDTLRAHTDDPRPAWRDLDALSSGRSGVALWDLAQRSLVRHGELHNNLRMSWGKVLAGWSRNPAQALARLLELNHRFALDGSDPASYGGLLWCLGLFDRPFPPARPVTGTVRQRSLAAHGARLDLPACARRVDLPSTGRARNVAIIGGGIAGAAAARVLADAGHRVCVLEKSRGAGGRMATRREAGLAFDHGAQFITVRDPRFRAQARRWREAGLLVPWRPRSAGPDEGRERLLAVPAMNALAAHLLTGIELRTSTTVGSLSRHPDGWRVMGAEGGELACADAVVVTAPAPQSASLLREPAPALAALLDEVGYEPCWAALLCLEAPVPDVELLRGGPDAPLALASAMASRAGRPQAPAWVVHAGAGWSRRHLEATPEQVLPVLVDAFLAAAGLPASAVRSASAHRWRYALCSSPLQRPMLHDAGLGLAVAGDGLLGGRVESAWLSGVAAAAALLRHWHLDESGAPAA